MIVPLLSKCNLNTVFLEETKKRGKISAKPGQDLDLDLDLELRGRSWSRSRLKKGFFWYKYSANIKYGLKKEPVLA